MRGVIVGCGANAFPTFYSTTLTNGATCARPTRVFVKTIPGIIVSSSTATAPSPVTLGHRISLVHIHLGMGSGRKGAGGRGATGKISFARSTSVVVCHLPSCLGIVTKGSKKMDTASATAGVLSVSSNRIFGATRPKTNCGPKKAVLGKGFAV